MGNYRENNSTLVHSSDGSVRDLKNLCTIIIIIIIIIEIVHEDDVHRKKVKRKENINT